MSARLLVLGAGAGTANNLVRALRASDWPLTIVGAHHDRFVLRGAATDGRYLLPSTSHPDFADALNRLIARERVDVTLPTSDADARALAVMGSTLSGRTLLPSLATIDLCQDKYAFAEFLDAQGVAVPETVALKTLDDTDAGFATLARHPRLWCRRRRGTGGLGALLVGSPEQARAWISYWAEMRGVDPSEFTLAEHLPDVTSPARRCSPAVSRSPRASTSGCRTLAVPRRRPASGSPRWAGASPIDASPIS